MKFIHRLALLLTLAASARAGDFLPGGNSGARLVSSSDPHGGVPRSGVAVGTVAAIEDFGAGELLDVEKPDGKRSLIPFRDGVADLVDGRIVLDPDFLA